MIRRDRRHESTYSIREKYTDDLIKSVNYTTLHSLYHLPAEETKHVLASLVQFQTIATVLHEILVKESKEILNTPLTKRVVKGGRREEGDKRSMKK